LHKFPDAFVPFVKRVLGNKNNLNDTGIHHEYFLLLQNGYPVLDKEGQVLLIKAILDGPPMDYVERLARWAEERHEENPKLYIDNQIKFWKRQRLWMLKEYLGQDNQQYLNELIEEFGEPEHPTFTHWVSGFQRVVQIAPISFDQLSSMSPHELLKFLNNWKPEDKRRSIFEEISYEGLALEVAKLIDSNYEYYQDYLGQIALIRPEFANSIFRFLIENKNADIPWEIVLDLMNYLLKDDSIRENMDRSFRVSWVDVRRSLVNLIEVGLLNEKRSIPMSELAKVKKILLILIHDPDPTNDSDQLEEGSFGYDDPITLAINHVRPNALIALMEYARFRSSLIQKAVDDGQEIDLSPRSLEIDVEQAITNKLDRIGDPSLAVHSVFGQHLSLLYWFNKDWVITHLDDILPEGSLEKSTRFFVAAWDSYVLHNHFYRPLFEIMRTKYELGIKNLVNGMVTKTHGNVSQHLAAHLFSDYIFSDYELHSAEGQNSLLVLLYEQPLPEAHSDLAGLLWRFASAHETDLLKYWPKIRSLWEWRVQKAAALNNPNTFDREMQFLAYLPGVAPLNETLDTMWALMIGLIPHISRSNNEFLGWRSLEKYLSKVVEYNPQKAVKFYRLMYEASPQNRRFSKRKEIDNIIEIAALNKDARQEVLNLIDVMARMGIHQYREVYFRLT
jgi:hypothetical protein